MYLWNIANDANRMFSRYPVFQLSSDRSCDKQTRCQWGAQCQPTLPRSGETISWAPTSGDPWPTGVFRSLPLPTHRSIPSSSRAKWPWVRPRTFHTSLFREKLSTRDHNLCIDRLVYDSRFYAIQHQGPDKQDTLADRHVPVKLRVLIRPIEWQLKKCSNLLIKLN